MQQESHPAHGRGGSEEFKGFGVNYLCVHLLANAFIPEFQTVYYVEILKIQSLVLNTDGEVPGPRQTSLGHLLCSTLQHCHLQPAGLGMAR